MVYSPPWVKSAGGKKVYEPWFSRCANVHISINITQYRRESDSPARTRPLLGVISELTWSLRVTVPGVVGFQLRTVGMPALNL